MELKISNMGYYRMSIECCEEDLKDIRQIMFDASEDPIRAAELRAVAYRFFLLMTKQKDMPQ